MLMRYAGEGNPSPRRTVAERAAKSLYYPDWFFAAVLLWPGDGELRQARRRMSCVWRFEFPYDTIIYPRGIPFDLQLRRFLGIPGDIDDTEQARLATRAARGLENLVQHAPSDIFTKTITEQPTTLPTDNDNIENNEYEREEARQLAHDSLEDVQQARQKAEDMAQQLRKTEEELKQAHQKQQETDKGLKKALQDLDKIRNELRELSLAHDEAREASESYPGLWQVSKPVV
ncbi:hypothetical protein NM208_g11046 [Fusarium decemcellulare]|uniref:Uncharacterized protein n=1 Tax=Fusarium decemcellulare TaxID=57161 RepID=A0ACC1RVP7_9HYPO|nr:hypothetical protein NM208_g11046 [Fusarium decemcellulare]